MATILQPYIPIYYEIMKPILTRYTLLNTTNRKPIKFHTKLSSRRDFLLRQISPTEIPTSLKPISHKISHFPRKFEPTFKLLGQTRRGVFRQKNPIARLARCTRAHKRARGGDTRAKTSRRVTERVASQGVGGEGRIRETPWPPLTRLIRSSRTDQSPLPGVTYPYDVYALLMSRFPKRDTTVERHVDDPWHRDRAVKLFVMIQRNAGTIASQGNLLFLPECFGAINVVFWESGCSAC